MSKQGLGCVALVLLVFLVLIQDVSARRQKLEANLNFDMKEVALESIKEAALASHWPFEPVLAVAEKGAASVAANAAGVAANAAGVANVAGTVAGNVAGVAANSQVIGQLGLGVANNQAAITGLVSSLGMLSGSVAANSASIAGLSLQVATLAEVATPTIALAEFLGVSISTVSSLSLAGSFVGPALGCVLLIMMCWPQEDSDPWWKLEARVSEMINDRFNQERRKKLGNRLKRYIMEFSRCSTAWIAHATTRNNYESGSFMELNGMRPPVAGEVGNVNEHARLPGEPDTPVSQAAPTCMSFLEGQMSIERDEWMGTEGDDLSGLFMPFANLHTQMQSLLHDYPDTQSRQMRWDLASTATSAEYANFMIDHLKSAWGHQMCRTVRMRHSHPTGVRALSWKYGFAVLKPEWQPNAGQDCFSQCGNKAGWCDFCGGKGFGACCKFGAGNEEDPSECQQFHGPEDKGRVCVHKDCAQRNTYYHTKGAEVLASTDRASDDWNECQEFCVENVISVSKDAHVGGVFNLVKGWFGKYTCTCLGLSEGTGSLHRYSKEDSISGPIRCSGEEHNYQTNEEKEETPHVPMKELTACSKSEIVGNVNELQEKHTDWLENCYQNASALVIGEYNPFYKRFAKFVDKLAVRAGCPGANLRSLDEENWVDISPEFDGGSFAQCNWEDEEEHERKRGITGSSRVVFDDQKSLKLEYPLPEWLRRLVTLKPCLTDKYNTKAGVGGQETQVLDSLKINAPSH